MEVIGIVAEYNPFHNGHKYHIDKIKEMYKDSVIVACISSCFTQRGELSVLNKWDKTRVALLSGVDLVIELPFVYSSQSADIFASGALKLLNELRVDKIVFGSESNDIEKLYEIASVQVNNSDFDSVVKRYLDDGENYPTSISKALDDFGIERISSPNDLLGISYVKEIIKNSYDIMPVTIKRTNNYHGNNKGNILSATEIRKLYSEGSNINKYVPYSSNILYKNKDYFPFLKYQIINNYDNLDKYQTTSEGIENRIRKSITKANSLEDMVSFIKTKRYTYNKINRMLIHILTGLTKEEAQEKIDYIRILGFNNKGKNYLNKIKKNTGIPIITRYKDIDSKLLDIEKRATYIYSLIVQDKSLMKKELERPIYVD